MTMIIDQDIIMCMHEHIHYCTLSVHECFHEHDHVREHVHTFVNKHV